MKFLRYLSYAYNIGVAYTPLSEAFVTFQITQPSDIEVRGFIVVKHRGNLPYDHYRSWGDKARPDGTEIIGSGPVGWGFRGALRGPGATEADVTVTTTVNASGSVGKPDGMWIKGAKVADNLMSLERHYSVAPILWDAVLTTSGWYRFELWGAMHGANGYVLPNDFSAVEVNGEGGAADPYNSLSIKVTPQ